MKRSFFILVLLLLSASTYSQINFNGYIIGEEVPLNKSSVAKMPFGGHYGHFEAQTNQEGIITGVTFQPQKSKTSRLLTKGEYSYPTSLDCLSGKDNYLFLRDSASNLLLKPIL
ncbi:hypothetical protein [Flammeovirga sp. SJP92]|uniref:hypothetical protein n=1 Tax=Flammeovirga sp. SJP92 TaxID=1775430 RepID=UPI0007869ADC|nr:hypothetical protein [Flammeovirga sp. SJP92]KXX70633.1 hypothetical protein AVL50_07365 [Flammeovirga sp. SJP92]